MDFTIVVIVAVIGLLFFTDVFDKDDSDSDDKRSGLIVYTDHATQLQYLSTWSGSIIPRMNPDGSHRHTADSQVRND